MQRNEANDNGEEPVTKKIKIMPKRKIKRKRSHSNNKKVKETKTPPKAFSYFPDLPTDLQHHVASFMSFDDYPNAAVTSKGFYHLANSPHFWLNKFKTHFPNEVETVKHSRVANWVPDFPPNPNQHTFASLFKEQHEHSNESLPRDIAELFHIVKDGADEDFDPDLYNLEDLCMDNNEGVTAARLAANSGHQPLLDKFYRIALEYFKEDGDVDAYDPEKLNDLNQNLLHWAILCKQPIDHISALIGFGFDVNFPDGDDLTPLHFAAISNYPAAINLLLERGATLDVRDANEYSPLHFAAENGNTENVQTLLTHRVEVDALDSRDATPLMLASGFGHTACVKLLLAHRANIHLSCDGDGTALNFAANYGHIDLVKFLVEAGAIITARSSKNRTVLETTIEKGFHECLDYFLGRNLEFIHERSHDQQSLLTVAARAGSRRCIPVLINRGASINEVSHGDDSTTPLIQAALNDHIDCVQALIAAGATIDLQCDSGYTALLAAVENGNTACVEFLLKMGANPNCREKLSGMTALMTAANEGHTDCVRLLLEHGASIEERDVEEGWPALFFAVQSNNLECVELLCKYGADTTLAIEKSKEELQQAATSSYSKFHMFAVLRKIVGERTTKTAEEFAKMLGHREISNYLEGIRMHEAELEADALRAFW